MSVMRSLVFTAVTGLAMASAIPSTAQAGDPAWPFNQPSIDTLRASPKKVFAHYFTPFPLWRWYVPNGCYPAPVGCNDNGSHDIYTEYLEPNGESGAHLATGGYLRERPLPTTATPATDADWELHNAEEEVRRAVALGLDGFAIDILWDQIDPSQPAAASDWHRVLVMMQAALNVDPDSPGHTGFKILLMPDNDTGWANDINRLSTAMKTLGAYASAYRVPTCKDSFNNTQTNCLVVAPYDAGNGQPTGTYWNTWKISMQGSGVPVAFVPVLINWWNYKNVLSGYPQISYGFSDWSTASSAAQPSWAIQGTNAHQAVSLWMGPVKTQDSRPKNNPMIYFENTGSAAYRGSWDNAICDGSSSGGGGGNAAGLSSGGTAVIGSKCGSATSTSHTDWVQITTWNDYSEHGEIAPSTRTQYAFYDLSAYYTTWFKTGAQPAITKDVIYYFYRRHTTGAATSSQTSGPAQLQKPAGDVASDRIELLAFLTANADLTITLPGATPTVQHVTGVPAGGEIVSFSIPMPTPQTTPITPQFSLTRTGTTISINGNAAICNTIAYQDLLYQAGGSSRTPLPGSSVCLSNPPTTPY